MAGVEGGHIDIDSDMSSNPSGMIAICAISDVPVDGGLRVDLPGRPSLAVFRVGSAYFVTDDECTHGNASLSDGVLDGDEVICPYHLGAFCVRTGEPTRAPCHVPLRIYPAELRGDRIFASLG